MGQPATNPIGLQYCTLTGVDDSTPVEALCELALEFPFVEFGLLYSPSRRGMPGRYPSFVTLQQVLERLPAEIHVAVHMCGRGVQDLLDEEPFADELGHLLQWRSGRVQLNFNHSRERMDVARLNAFAASFEAQVIVQHNQANAECVKAFNVPNRAVLFDESGGCGKTPGQWPRPLPGVYCGYAGGLGPGNLRQLLPAIQRAAGDEPYWIDMESSLRDENDRFDVSRARQVLEIVRDFRACA